MTKELIEGANQQAEKVRLLETMRKELARASEILNAKRVAYTSETLMGKTIVKVSVMAASLLLIFSDDTYLLIEASNDWDGPELDWTHLSVKTAHRFGLLSREEFEQYQRAKLAMDQRESRDRAVRSLEDAIQLVGKDKVRNLLERK